MMRNDSVGCYKVNFARNSREAWVFTMRWSRGEENFLLPS
ncbi:hypothetical protein HMPREF1870_01542 [Bacteroidales bacterium KA00344]|nr:hypothetical protein HMPREF1870_01542 [Bacteroidales bacterium KA00344]